MPAPKPGQWQTNAGSPGDTKSPVPQVQPSSIQTLRITYVVTSSDQSNLFARIPVTLPQPYFDTNYSVFLGIVLNSDSFHSPLAGGFPFVETFDSDNMGKGLNAPLLPMGFTVNVPLGSVSVGAVIILQITTVHD